MPPPLLGAELWPFVLVVSVDRNWRSGGWYLPQSDTLTKRVAVVGEDEVAKKRLEH